MPRRIQAFVAIAVLVVAGVGATTALGVGGKAKKAQAALPAFLPISAREYKFTGQKTLKPGPTTFAVANRGAFPHNFTVVQGPVKFTVPTTLPGQQTLETVNLVPGAYLAICTVRNGGHMRDGMVRVFTVGTQDPATGEWHA